MEHFIAYHSAHRMGYQYKSSERLRFLSRKLGFLKKAVGNTVWVVQGTPDGRKTAYTLCGAYIAEGVDIEEPSSNLYVIFGEQVKEFSPPLPLNNLDWFPALFRSQRNFSLGFNRISDETIVQALTALPDNENPPSSTSALADIDLFSAGVEGAARLVPHLRRERDRALVAAKKAATLAAKGHLCCEACGFDFSVTYGALGDGFCEVHHLVPLGASDESVVTTLDELAVLCSNCHRIIHRSTPMLSVVDLSEMISRGRPNGSFQRNR